MPARRASDDSEDDGGKSKVALSKRRKTETAFVPTFRQDLSSDDEQDSDASDSDEDVSQIDASAAESGDADNGINQSNDDTHISRKAPAIKKLTTEELSALNAAKARTGVIYLSRVPPFMKPQTVRHLLSAYGETGRIFLAPEAPESRKKRRKFGGNKKKMFTEGWIEFTDKRKAKLVAETLNAQKIGGKRKSFYAEDLWNIKYLPKFKWDDLTAQIAAENASRQARLNAELEQGKREASHYIKNAERAKMIANIQKTRAERSLANNKPVSNNDDQKLGKEEERVRRHFNQRDVKDKTKKSSTETGAQDAKMTRVMANIFG